MVGEGPFALFLGRIEWKKGLDRLIDALPLAPGVKLVIAGNDDQGYQRTLEARAAGKGVRARVQFVGPVNSEARLLQLAAQLEHARPWFDKRPNL